MKNAWQLEPFYFLPQKRAGNVVFPKDSPSPPPAPDYAGAATATSQGSVQAAIANQLLNQRRTTTPLGTQDFKQIGSYSVPGVGGQPGFELPRYEQTINMTPEGQNLYDQQMGLSTGLLGLGQNSLDQTRANLGEPQNYGSVQDIANDAYRFETDRLDPQWQQYEKMQETKLVNQGLAPGGEAYDDAMRTFSQGKNDAYTQARRNAFNMMAPTFQLDVARRTQPLTELNAIRTGAQPQMPQFQPVPAAGGAQGPNMLGAAQGQAQYDQGLYNSQVAGQNSMMSGLMGLAGTGAKLAFGGPFGAMV